MWIMLNNKKVKLLPICIIIITIDTVSIIASKMIGRCGCGGWMSD